MKRPTPYTPLSMTFATGRTGTAILDRFGLEGLGVWAAMLAAAKYEEGLIVFKHEEDWGAIGLASAAPEFTLKSFITFLGHRKQTRTTRQGRVMYVELTRWEEWNKKKERAESAWRKSRSRGQSKRDIKRDSPVTTPGHERDSRARRELELEVELEQPPDPPSPGGQKISRRKPRYTGCRETKGSHGVGYVRDPLGTDRPPADWPHPPPSAGEVKAALEQLNGARLLHDEPDRFIASVGWSLDEESLEAMLALHVPDEDERIRLAELAADLRREAEATTA